MKTNAHQGRSRIANSREVVENTRSKLVQSLYADYSQGTSGSSSSLGSNNIGSEIPEPDGLQALSRIQRRLGSMKLGKLRTSLDLVDKAAKVCSIVSTSPCQLAPLRSCHNLQQHRHRDIYKGAPSLRLTGARYVPTSTLRHPSTDVHHVVPAATRSQAEPDSSFLFHPSGPRVLASSPAPSSRATAFLQTRLQQSTIIFFRRARHQGL